MGNIIFSMIKEYNKLDSMKALSKASLTPANVNSIGYILNRFTEGVMVETSFEEDVANWFKVNGCKVKVQNGRYIISVV